MNNPERSIPYSIEAEEGVLGSILIDPEAMRSITLSPDDFYRDIHRTIYAVMLSLSEQNILPDYITVSHELEKLDKIEEVGRGYLLKLIDLIPSSVQIKRYAEIVKEMASYRWVISYAGVVANLAYTRDPEVFAKMEDLLRERLSQSDESTYSAPVATKMYMDLLDDLYANRGAFTGIPTGYRELDQMLAGLQKGDLIILGGRPGSGKTSLGLNIAVNAADAGYSVLVFSLEMKVRPLYHRLMAIESGVNMLTLRTGQFVDSFDEIVNAAGVLSDRNLWVNDASQNTIQTIRERIRTLLRTNKIDLVVVDYLQLIDPGQSNGNRVQDVSALSLGLKRIAGEFDVPVLALASLSRVVEQRGSKMPQMSDLRDSGSIESDADVVMFLYYDDYYAEQEKRERARPNIADVIIAKQRNGPTGIRQLYFRPEQTRFFDLEREDQ